MITDLNRPQLKYRRPCKQINLGDETMSGDQRRDPKNAGLY